MTDQELESIRGELKSWKEHGGAYPEWTRSVVEKLVAEVDRLRAEVEAWQGVIADFQEDVSRAVGLDCPSVTALVKRSRDAAALEIINVLERNGYSGALETLASRGLLIGYTKES